MGFVNYYFGEIYLYIANRYRMIGDDAQCADYLERGLEYVYAYDTLPEEVVHTAFAVHGLKFRKSEVYSGYEGNAIKLELENLASLSIYDDVRNTDWYQKIIKRFAPFASDTK